MVPAACDVSLVMVTRAGEFKMPSGLPTPCRSNRPRRGLKASPSARCASGCGRGSGAVGQELVWEHDQ